MQIATTEAKTNDDIINKYFNAMQTEINPNYNYIKVNRNTLTMFSRFHKNNKLFTKMKRKTAISLVISRMKKCD
jgi:hypothetical protein